ncbi:N-acetylmuramoyl-L-alanine amidase [Streptomyces piniterrae]|uniref:N-acetylmuramoyl-L-alanine amidase n=1 Tax=Streptomyces piniterrae TaxID=2571125 RepID=A0A4V5MLR4_9ACTN|nr:peptidoglycan-binding protein [Streptomyces piniterrae]TJZ56818.1 N-acetylmuramoyl-L-alanine amidase [Streptomyces piniterrae]
MNLTELRTLATEVGFTGSDINIAAAVAMAESSGNPGAVGDENLVDNKWGPSFGLFQIRSLKHPEQFSPPDTLRIAGKLKDPVFNAKAAKAIKKAHGWNQWSTFTSGAYRQFMDGGSGSGSGKFEPFPGASFFHTGQRSPIITAMHNRLVAEDCNRYTSSRDADVWGSGDVKSYAAWQHKLHLSGPDADGIPGKSSWDKLHVPNV